MRTNDSRNLSVDALNERRRQVVECLGRAMTQVEAASLCGMSPVTVGKIARLFKAGGIRAIVVNKTGRPVGKGRRLTSEQERDAQKVIMDRTPDQLKLPYALWNRQAVREMIEQRYQRKLSIRTVGLYLERWGYSPQKPLQRAYEQQPAAVQRWKEQQYPAIKVRAAREGATIYWGDETSLRSDDVRGRSYSKQGTTPVIRVRQIRHGCSVIASVTNTRLMRWMVFKGALNADILIVLLRSLIKGAERKIFLILDNLRVHHSKKVKEWVEQRNEAIELFFLPSYSPQLNPVELANASLKHAVTTHAPARKKGQLEKVASAHLRSLKRTPKKIISFFQKDTIKYAA